MKLFLSILLVVCVRLSLAQEEIQLWEGIPPFYKESDLKEYQQTSDFGVVCSYDVVNPTITYYIPEVIRSEKAVLIIPGGGYELVAIHHEGHDVAQRLFQEGIPSAVLKYRVPNRASSDRPEMVPLTDARQALRLFRDKLKESEIGMIGMIGFSAGSHLATVASLWPVENNLDKPDFSGLIYGVTRLDDANQEWLESSLFYRKMKDEEIKSHTLLELVNEDTPPAFLVHAYDDKICHVSESTEYADRLFAAGVAVESYLFQNGGHGFGLGRKSDGTDQWISLFIQWLSRL